MTEPNDLSDAELLARSHQWRRQALQGERDARGRAHEHEAELRRRFGATTMLVTFDSKPAYARGRQFWRFW